MGSDRARVSYDPNRHYRSVVMQQGRVTLEADWNEDDTIHGEELRHETLDIVGPAGTPDDGYRVVQTNQPPKPPFDFTIGGGGPQGSGTMYVGGVRLTLDAPIQYSQQPDWLDHFADPDWVMPTSENPAANEFVYLFVREQEISAVEDSVLRDVALGGPDTAQRTRMIQHIVRLATQSTDCADGLAAAEAYWTKEGLVFDPATMRLNPQSTLQASFQNAPKPDPCEPEVAGGYLGADNQLIRIQIIDQNTLVWGFDDASFLYRVKIDPDRQTLTLQSQPVDAFHQPQANQAVEVLRSAAQLANKEYVASATGAPTPDAVQTLVTSYNQDTMQIELPAPLPPQYTVPVLTPQAFLRVWQQELTFTPKTPVELGTTGLFVTLDTKGGAPFHVGDYWLIAVRPTTPTQLYPQRYLDAPQFPEGARMWACPLAAIEWDNGILKVDEDCRKQFCNLVEACSEKSSGCCTVSISPGDLTGTNTLQMVIGNYANRGPVKICLGPGIYELTEPLMLRHEHSYFTFEACPGGVTLRAAKGSESAFQQGLITLSEAQNVTFRGLTFDLPLVLSTLRDPQIYVSVGLRPVGCPKLSVEDCSFDFSTPPDGKLPLAVGIFGGGNCIGLRVIGSRFNGAVNSDGNPIGFQFGFVLSPSTTLLPAAGANAAVSATSLGPWLDDAVLRDNFFGSLAVPVFVYADCGLVKLESNTVRDSLNGFIFSPQLLLASTFNMANVTVAPAHVEVAVQLHNALFNTLANPQFQIASAVLRGFPLPANFDLAKAQTVTPGAAAATDISRIQVLFDRILPSAAAPPVRQFQETEEAREAVQGRIALTENLSTLRVHPFNNILPAVPASVVASNQIFSAVENQAFAAAATQTVPVALHINDNDVDAKIAGPFSGFGLLVVSFFRTDRDALNLAGNTFTATGISAYTPVAVVAGDFRCTITGNIILNVESSQLISDLAWSLFVFAGKQQVAITGNVLRRQALLLVPPPQSQPPQPPLPPPLNSWYIFNSISI
jgi:hypothetical protein